MRSKSQPTNIKNLQREYDSYERNQDYVSYLSGTFNFKNYNATNPSQQKYDHAL